MMQEQLSHVEGFKQQFDMETANLQQRKTMFNNLVDNLNSLGGDNAMQNAMIGVPRVIYASRTHSQISQGFLSSTNDFNKKTKNVYQNLIFFF